MTNSASEFDLKTRYQIYQFFVAHGRAPAYTELTEMLNVEKETVRFAFHKLHERHMIFLESGTDEIRMANPFSAIPTPFRVTAGSKAWWANCAWDCLGIAAAINLDVEIEARYADTQATIELRVEHGLVHGKNLLIYFPLPCRHWYDDLIFT